MVGSAIEGSAYNRACKIGLVYHGWFCRAIEGSGYNRACKIIALQPGKEEELSSSKVQLGKGQLNIGVQIRLSTKMCKSSTVI